MSTEQILREGRLHPVTPWRRAWAAVTGVVAFLVRDIDSWARALVVLPVWALGLVAFAVAGAVTGYGFLAWWRTSWRLTTTTLHVSSGVLFHRRRTIELASVQEVDLHRSFIGRLIGVCSLRISVAGSSEDLAYLGEEQAAALRQVLRVHLAGTGSEPVAESRPSERVLLSVSSRLLGLAILLEVHTLGHVAMVLAGGLVPYLVFGQPWALVSLAGSLGWVWRLTAGRWPAWHGWTVTAQAGGYRTECGLFNRRYNTLRHERVQAVAVTQPVLWRRWDWVRVEMAMAGERDLVLLAPVTTRQRAEGLITSLLGAEALDGLRIQAPAPRRARWATVRSGVLSAIAGPVVSAVWRGLFLRSVVQLWPTGNVQRVEVRQGPWQRRLRLATVGVELVGGPDIRARHRDVAEAAVLAGLFRAGSGGSGRGDG